MRASDQTPLVYEQDRSLVDLQQAFLDLRFGMFVHFNMATFQDREWGDPDGPMDVFDPKGLDTDQWADAAVDAGMSYGCLTTKHHDGFCLWPTKSGGDSILDTPGKVDVVQAFVDSFRSRDLRVGLYYSILDLRGDIRHHNVEPEDIARIKLEITELLTNYGDVDFLIFDGWDAPWSRIPYEEVPFDEIYALVKSLQPNCLVLDLNAASYPPSALYYTDIKSFEQNAGQHMPEGSALPAVSCVTLTNGWFWKQSDIDGPLKTTEQVVDEWLLPQNKQFGNLILNASPDRNGRLAPNVVARLHEIGEKLRAQAPLDPMPTVQAHPVITTTNLATGATIHASRCPDTVGPDLANDGRFASTFHWPGGEDLASGWLEVEFDADTDINQLAIAEPIGRWGDYAHTRMASYTVKVKAEADKGWQIVAKGDTDVPVRVLPIDPVSVKTVRFEFTWPEGGPIPHVSQLGLYNEPMRVAR